MRPLDCSAVLLAFALVMPAQATEVALVGLYSGKALIVVDGGRPKSVAVGASTSEGVKLLSLEEGAANFQIDGRRQRLTIGQHAVSAGNDSREADIATLNADAAGHFITVGTVNGAPTRFLVDTGASVVSMSAVDASRANIDFRKGQPVMMMTANGPARAWRVTLRSVRVGDIVLNQVEGSVLEANLPFALLGMSFLNRTEMQRDGNKMILKKRF